MFRPDTTLQRLEANQREFSDAYTSFVDAQDFSTKHKEGEGHHRCLNASTETP